MYFAIPSRLSAIARTSLTMAAFAIVPFTASAQVTAETDTRPLPQLTVPFDEQAFDAEFQSHFTRIDGLRIHYVMGGEGPPLVLLHGWPESSYSFRQIMPELGKHFTVIAPDLRGFGDSDRPPSNAMSKEEIAADVTELVERLGHEEVSIVGHDWGGAIAYEMAWRNPGLVDQLVFFEMVLPGFKLDDPAFVAGYWQFGFHTSRDFPEMLLEGKEAEYMRAIMHSPNIYNPNAFTAEDIAEYERIYTKPGSTRAWLQIYRQAAADGERYKAWAAERKLDMPVLALGGETSMRSWTEEDMRQVATDVTGGIIPQFGHFIEENPQGALDALLPFLLEGINSEPSN